MKESSRDRDSPMVDCDVTLRINRDRAGKTARVLNNVIDHLTVFSFLLFVFTVIVLTSIISGTDFLLHSETFNTLMADKGSPSTVMIWAAIWLLIINIYRVGFEWITGTTPGKLITSTRVVTINGQRPSLKAVLIRTLCRHIPLNGLSGFANHGMWWHDTMSKTCVLKITDTKRPVLPVLLVVVLNVGMIGLTSAALYFTEDVESQPAVSMMLPQTHIVTVDAHSLSFECPNTWDIEDYGENESKEYWVIAYPPSSDFNTCFSVISSSSEIETSEWMTNFAKGCVEEYGLRECTFGRVFESAFRPGNSYVVDFAGSYNGTTTYFRLTAMKDKGKVVGLLQQAPKQHDLGELFERQMSSITFF